MIENAGACRVGSAIRAKVFKGPFIPKRPFFYFERLKCQKCEFETAKLKRHLILRLNRVQNVLTRASASLNFHLTTSTCLPFCFAEGMNSQALLRAKEIVPASRLRIPGHSVH